MYHKVSTHLLCENEKAHSAGTQTERCPVSSTPLLNYLKPTEMHRNYMSGVKDKTGLSDFPLWPWAGVTRPSFLQTEEIASELLAVCWKRSTVMLHTDYENCINLMRNSTICTLHEMLSGQSNRGGGEG